jgi:hypothetical protein
VAGKDYMRPVTLVAILAILLTMALPPATARAGYEHAGCAQDISGSTKREDEAKNESDANDYPEAYADYQSAAVYRANCADETDGAARQWNRMYEAMDYLFLSFTCDESDVDDWKAQSPGYLEKAHTLANDLLNEAHLPRGVRDLAQNIWEHSKPSE